MLFLYCPKCNNLMDKINETVDQGGILQRKCNRCNAEVRFLVKYKALSSLVYKNGFDDKTKKEYNSR